MFVPPDVVLKVCFKIVFVRPAVVLKVLFKKYVYSSRGDPVTVSG